MTILIAQPIPQTQTVTPDSDLNLVLTEDWFIETDATAADWAATNPLFFIGDPAFPAIGSTHPRSSTLRFESFGNAEQQSANKWRFEGMRYTTRQRPSTADFRQDRYDGSLRADRSWSYTTVGQVLDYALAVADPAHPATLPVSAGAFTPGPVPVASTTGEPLLGVTERRYLSQCTYVRNELAPPAALVTGDLVGTVNSDAFVCDGIAIPARVALLKNLTVSSEKYSIDHSTGNQIGFRTVTYTLAFDPRGWDTSALNQGFYELHDNAGDKLLRRIKVPDGFDTDGGELIHRYASVPMPLDINSVRIPTSPGEPGYDPAWASTSTHYRYFQTKRLIAFAGFAFS